MSNQNEVVYVVKINITRSDLEECIKYLNRDIDDGEAELTIEEVLSKPDLLTYICDNRIRLDDIGPLDCWNCDGWTEWKDFR